MTYDLDTSNDMTEHKVDVADFIYGDGYVSLDFYLGNGGLAMPFQLL